MKSGTLLVILLLQIAIRVTAHDTLIFREIESGRLMSFSQKKDVTIKLKDREKFDAVIIGFEKDVLTVRTNDGKEAEDADLKSQRHSSRVKACRMLKLIA